MERAKVIGEKIYLRALERSDIENGWHNWINDGKVTVNLVNPFPQTIEMMNRYYDSIQNNNNVMFAVCDKKTGLYIGNAKLGSINWVNRTADYGRLIGHADYRGKGYGTDTLIQLFRYGFHTLGLNRLWTTVWASNEASLRSNDKVGLVREGVMRQSVFKNGAFQDTTIFSMLREDFDRIHGGPEKWENRG